MLQSQLTNGLESCGTKNDYFTVFPLAEGDYGGITPLGNLNPTAHTFPTDHIYVYVKGGASEKTNNDGERLTIGKPLLSPAEMMITTIESSEEVGKITDYGIRFSVCNELAGEFGHVGSLSQKLQDAIAQTQGKCDEYETGGERYRSCRYDELNLRVSAGEVLGTAGDGRSHFLDIWTTDRRLPNIQYANSSRWREDSLYVACPLDYFESALKEKVYTMIGDQYLERKRTKEPRCGTVATDIAGTAQGVWFYNWEGQMQQEDAHLALAFDNLETDKQVFSAGTSFSKIGLQSGRYMFTPKNAGFVNRDFSQVMPDENVYCYETQTPQQNRAVLLLQMSDAEHLKIGKATTSSCGRGAWILETSVEYDR